MKNPTEEKRMAAKYPKGQRMVCFSGCGWYPAQPGQKATVKGHMVLLSGEVVPVIKMDHLPDQEWPGWLFVWRKE